MASVAGLASRAGATLASTSARDKARVRRCVKTPASVGPSRGSNAIKVRRVAREPRACGTTVGARPSRDVEVFFLPRANLSSSPRADLLPRSVLTRSPPPMAPTSPPRPAPEDPPRRHGPSFRRRGVLVTPTEDAALRNFWYPVHFIGSSRRATRTPSSRSSASDGSSPTLSASPRATPSPARRIAPVDG